MGKIGRPSRPTINSGASVFAVRADSPANCFRLQRHSFFEVAWGNARRIHSARFSRMAFNLKKVLKALLLSSNQPLAVKDIQGAFTRFHEQQTMPLPGIVHDDAPAAEAQAANGEGQVASGEKAVAVETGEVAEVSVELPGEAELYQDVPSLVTATQIREAMDLIAVELRTADDGLLLIEGSHGYRLVTLPQFARWVRILRQEPPPVKLSQSSLETLAVIAYRQPVTRTEIETIRGVSAEAGLNKLLERDLVYIVGRADLPGRPLQYGTTDKFLEYTGIKSLDELPASDVLSSRQIDEWLKNATNPNKPGDADMGLETEQLTLSTAESASVAEPASASAEVVGAPIATALQETPSAS